MHAQWPNFVSVKITTITCDCSMFYHASVVMLFYSQTSFLYIISYFCNILEYHISIQMYWKKIIYLK